MLAHGKIKRKQNKHKDDNTRRKKLNNQKGIDMTTQKTIKI